jgi:hypothetical protein
MKNCSIHTWFLSARTLILVSGVTIACTHGQGQQSSQSEDEYYDEEALIDGEFYEGPKLVHPAKPTAYATRVLLTTANLPLATDLAKCADEMQAIANKASSKDLLAQAQMSLMNPVSANPTLYHFCFYSMMMELDQKLELGGPIMTDLADQFFAGFRALWILGRTLDASSGTSAYFDYLRKRYVQISKDYFGRNLERYRAPSTNDGTGEMGDVGGGWGNKPAGRAPVD